MKNVIFECKTRRKVWKIRLSAKDILKRTGFVTFYLITGQMGLHLGFFWGVFQFICTPEMFVLLGA